MCKETEKETYLLVKIKEQQRQLNSLLKNDGECISDKRNNNIEKIQLDIIIAVCVLLNMKYHNIGVTIDISRVVEIKKQVNQWYIDSDGNILSVKDKNRERNPYYDSKTFDVMIRIKINGKEIILFGILKGVEYAGGHQDDVKKEIGVYSKQIQQNQDENYYFFFLLDGTYINKDINKLDKTHKYFVTTSENLYQNLENFILNKLN